jgi:hypothetical protein
MSALSTRIQLLRAALTADREGRAKQRQLEHELASYSTPSERLDIEEIVARHGEDETRQIRRILDRNAA